MGNDFEWRYSEDEIIFGAVRWHCCCRISYREFQEMLVERGANADHITLYRRA